MIAARCFGLRDDVRRKGAAEEASRASRAGQSSACITHAD
ncbi:hypothetical protein BURMUCGD1_1040 [Burkholderia multivorans CGD1]|nr:hypothetical protein BURMUCGD1_1040 [Burkholderia multivorans CGD1]